MNKYSIEELKLNTEKINKANIFFLDDLNAFCEYLFKQGGIKLQQQLIPIKTIKEIVPELLFPVDIRRKRLETKIPYIFVLDTICRITGLSENTMGVMISKSSNIEKFNQMPADERITYIVEKYIENTLLNELKLIQGMKIEWKSPSDRNSILIHMRSDIINVLKMCEKGFWYSLSEIEEFIDTDTIFDKIKSAKFGMLWVYKDGEGYNHQIIPKLIISTIFDIVLRHIGIVSTYCDDSNFLEEISISRRMPVMFEYNGVLAK